MNRSRFLTQLVVGALGIAIVLFLVHLSPLFGQHQLLSWVSLAFFVSLSLIMYEVGYRAALSKNKNDFTNVVLLFMIGKMLFSVILIIGYFQLVQPDSRWFLLPFFGIYLYYTAFEAYFMMKLGKMKPEQT
ncbi:MAG: hypothetical protein AAGG75_11895 [Bacteroidota bacterium]